ncbi:MAG TPA: hypothetical protein VNF92_00155, partial [Gemmatimonadaceae bacterium]|nr:hypothetical protein [Gemmatimonadaceae bacterium]
EPTVATVQVQSIIRPGDRAIGQIQCPFCGGLHHHVVPTAGAVLYTARCSPESPVLQYVLRPGCAHERPTPHGRRALPPVPASAVLERRP